MQYYKSYRWDADTLTMCYAKMTAIAVSIRKLKGGNWKLSADWCSDKTVDGTLDEAMEEAKLPLDIWGEVSDRPD